MLDFRRIETVLDLVIAYAGFVGSLFLIVVPMLEVENQERTGFTGIFALFSSNLFFAILLIVLLIIWLLMAFNVAVRMTRTDIAQWRTQSNPWLTMPLALLGLGNTRDIEADTIRLGYWLGGAGFAVSIIVAIGIGSTDDVTVLGGYLFFFVFFSLPAFIANYTYLPAARRAIGSPFDFNTISVTGPTIVFKSGELQGGFRQLTVNQVVSIGNGDKDLFRLFRDQTVYPSHVQIMFDGQQTRIYVKAPIYVNRRPTMPGQYVLDGVTRLQIGSSIIEYRHK